MIYRARSRFTQHLRNSAPPVRQQQQQAWAQLVVANDKKGKDFPAPVLM
jgi:hypothetical protein